MDERQKTDRRLIERGIASRRTPKDEVLRLLDELPDYASQVAKPSAEELEKLRSDLETEQELRMERIQRALERAAEPPPLPAPGPVEPFEESEL